MIVAVLFFVAMALCAAVPAIPDADVGAALFGRPV